MAFTNIDSWTQRDRIYHDDAFEIVRIQDPEQNRTVLIKRAPGGSAQLNNRLHYEARLLESLKHPNLIRCLQFTTQGQTAVLILEDPGGVSLKDTLVAGALSLDKFFRYALQLAELLCVIHERGIIHKGINAHGLFITADGSRVLPLNFSSASRQITTSREFDFSGHRLQLLPYISPEQTGRMNRTVDHRSDIYSVG
ncbi:MAG: protein kinase, partial [Leptospiraceae bacterium]|nr:protein kinase [Leptospiraceae bacterium]